MQQETTALSGGGRGRSIKKIEVRQGRVMSLSEIAIALKAAGYTTAKGEQFTRAQIHRIKATPCHAG